MICLGTGNRSRAEFEFFESYHYIF